MGSRHEETYDSVYNGMAQRLTLPYLPSGSTVKKGSVDGIKRAVDLDVQFAE